MLKFLKKMKIILIINILKTPFYKYLVFEFVKKNKLIGYYFAFNGITKVANATVSLIFLEI